MDVEICRMSRSDSWLIAQRSCPLLHPELAAKPPAQVEHFKRYFGHPFLWILKSTEECLPLYSRQGLPPGSAVASEQAGREGLGSEGPPLRGGPYRRPGISVSSTRSHSGSTAEVAARSTSPTPDEPVRKPGSECQSSSMLLPSTGALSPTVHIS